MGREVFENYLLRKNKKLKTKYFLTRKTGACTIESKKRSEHGKQRISKRAEDD